MESKKWYKSKGVYGGILVLVGVAAKIIVTNEITAEDVSYAGVGLALLGIRFAQN